MLSGGFSRYVFGPGICGFGLVSKGEIGAGSSVAVHNAFGKQIRNCLSGNGFVGGEDVIEGAVLSNDDDHMLNGGCGFCRLSGALSGGWKWRSEVSGERD